MFSPNDKYIITGTSTNPKEEEGKLVVFERDSLKKVHEINVVDSVRLIFHFLFIFIWHHLIK